MIFGYTRVSTSGQNIENQIAILKVKGYDKIFTDIASGVHEDRKT